MTDRAITPFFRWLEQCRCPRDPRPGLEVYPAPESGNHPAEAWFLAAATFLLTATAVIPATSRLDPLWVRVPVVAVLIFLTPHVIMALVALASQLLAGPRLSREAAQDWSCLGIMTGYAAWGSAGEGWTAAICQGWLIFVGLNVVCWLAGWRRRLSPRPD